MRDITDIAIVTPSYNQVKYIDETIQSVISQQGVQVQYVIMDGGSNDGSDAIIERYRLKLHDYKYGPDEGQADAINKGFDLTYAKIMGYINSDDYYHPGALQKVKKYFDDNPSVDVLIGGCTKLSSSTDTAIDYYQKPIQGWQYLSPREGIANYIPQPSTFWRRRIWDSFGGFSLEYINAFDYEYFLRILVKGAKIGYIDDVLAVYRVHSSQKSSDISLIFREVEHISSYHATNVLLNKYQLLYVKNGLAWCKIKKKEYEIGNTKINNTKFIYYYRIIKFLFKTSFSAGLMIKRKYYLWCHQLYSR